MRHDRGSSSVEAVLIAPALVLLSVLVVSTFRVHSAGIRVAAAADAAARAASQVSRDRMTQAATATARAYLDDATPVCSRVATWASVEESPDGATVVVRVSCQLSNRGVSSLLHGRVLNATSTEVVDVFTYR
jgi:Flp pilus assembly protein TadG